MADLAGRIMLTHRLAPEHLMAVIDLTHEQAVALITEGRLSMQLDWNSSNGCGCSSTSCSVSNGG
ncbi:hypothetical protein [Sphingomonas hankookensis]|uniref:Uncharacterized protein n=1 Tax=Sphingomonas hengshuiensis TaxID=1609977 RepID=A0A2W4Z9D0_9SPHN|nr:MAG: hypothetical protein DI632_06680 [Sphingomonas hengshuiensis]